MVEFTKHDLESFKKPNDNLLNSVKEYIKRSNTSESHDNIVPIFYTFDLELDGVCYGLIDIEKILCKEGICDCCYNIYQLVSYRRTFHNIVLPDNIINKYNLFLQQVAIKDFSDYYNLRYYYSYPSIKFAVEKHFPEVIIQEYTKIILE